MTAVPCQKSQQDYKGRPMASKLGAGWAVVYARKSRVVNIAWIEETVALMPVAPHERKNWCHQKFTDFRPEAPRANVFWEEVHMDMF